MNQRREVTGVSKDNDKNIQALGVELNRLKCGELYYHGFDSERLIDDQVAEELRAMVAPYYKEFKVTIDSYSDHTMFLRFERKRLNVVDTKGRGTSR